MVPYLIPLFVIIYCMIQYDINGRIRNESIWYYGIMLYLIFLSGFAYRLGGDGQIYLNEYYNYSVLDGIGWTSLGQYQGRLPGWVLLNKLCRSICKEYWFFKLVHAIVLNVLIFEGIRNVSKKHFTCLLFYFVLLYPNLNFQLLRQALAIGFFLNAIPYFENNKWGTYCFVCGIGLLFHESILIAFLAPFVKFVKMNAMGLFLYVSIIIIFFLVSGTVVDTVMGALLSGDDVSTKLLHYSTEIEVGLRFSFFVNVLLNGIIPLFFIFIFAKNGERTIQMYMTLVYVFIYAVGLYIPILYRFNHYFVLFFYSFFIDIFSFLAKKIKRFRFGRVRFKPGYAFICLCLVLILFKSRMYFQPYGETPYPSYVQYYPYASVFTEKKDATREAMFSYF